MRQTFSSVFFPGYRRRVFRPLFLHPEETLRGDEIARPQACLQASSRERSCGNPETDAAKAQFCQGKSVS